MDSTYFLKTENGGEKWTFTSVSKQHNWLMDAQFINPDTGWVIGNGNIYKTIDGGTTWDSVAGNWSSSIYFIDKNTGWAASTFCWGGCAHQIFKTLDDINAGSDGPNFIFLMPRDKSVNSIQTAFCSYHDKIKDNGKSFTSHSKAPAKVDAIFIAEYASLH